MLTACRAAEKKMLIPFICVSLAVIIALSGAAVFAYYRWNAAVSTPVSYTEPAAGEVIGVNSFEELFAYSKDGRYNRDNPTSELITVISGGNTICVSANRKTLEFTSDITLTADLVITADCHINLNGHDLIMNGHTLTLANTYYGDFLFTGNGGRVLLSNLLTTSEREIIYTETPNGAVTFDGITFGSVEGAAFTPLTGAAAAAHQIALASDEEYLVYNAMFEVAAAVADESNHMRARISFSDLALPAELTPSYYFYDTMRYGTSSTPSSPYSFVFSDLDLPYHYNGYGNVTIAYVSSDESVLTNGGRLQGTGDSLTLTATVTAGSTTKTCEFSLFADNSLDSPDKGSYAAQMVKNILGYYYVENDATNQPFQKYVFNRDTILPTALSSLPGVVISYAGYDDGNTRLFPEDGIDPVATGNTVTFTPSKLITKLRFSVNADNKGETVYPDAASYYPMTSSNTGLVINGASLSNDLLTDWYGTEIDMTANYDLSGNYLSHSSQELYTVLRDPQDSLYTNYFSNLTAEYALSNDTEGYYQIVDIPGSTSKRLQVVSGTHPELDAQRVLLRVTLSMNYKSQAYSISIEIPIVSKKSNSSDTNLEMFLPYYNLYNRNFEAATGKKTASSFTLPFSDGISVPFIIYDYVVSSADITVAQKAVSALSLKLIYNNEVYTASRPAISVQAFRAVVQGYLTALDQHERDLTDAEWHIIASGTPSWEARTVYEWSSTALPQTPASQSGTTVFYSAPLYSGEERVFYYTPGATISLFYDGLEHVIVPSYTEDYAAELTVTKDSDGQSYSFTTEALLMAGNTMWRVYIDKATLPVYNTTLDILYAFKMEKSATTWSFYHTFSSLTLQGVVHNTAGEVENSGFYEWIYVKYNSSGDSTFNAGTDYVLSDWLGQSNTIDAVNDASLAGINDFRGIKYLIGVTSLDLSGRSCANVIPEIHYLTGLNTLKLTGCSLSFGQTDDYSDFEAWASLTRLSTLYIDGNSIYNFAWLSDIPNLTHAYIYGNTPDSDVNKVFYGSDGLTNYTVFHALVRKGVIVYNTVSNGSPNNFLDSNTTSTTYLNLIGITYQDKLPAGVSITRAYQGLSTSWSDYTGTPTTVKNSSEVSLAGCTVTLTFGYNSALYSESSATGFTVTMRVAYGGTTYNVVVNYAVSRV